MTHDELLKRLEGLWHDSFKAPGYQALRAVVELHKPSEFKVDATHDGFICAGCKTDDDYYSQDYPCATIQAIQKELG